MGRLLTQRGHTVSFACDGTEFVATMLGEDPASILVAGAAVPAAVSAGGGKGRVAPSNISVSFDAILIDRHMPNLEGPEAVRYYMHVASLSTK